MSMGERLRAARKARGLSQETLGNAAGVTKQSVSKYEDGKSMPSSGVLSRLARALEVKVEFLLRPGPVPQVTVWAYRKHSGLTAKEQTPVVAKVREWLERYLDAESLLPLEDRRPFRPPWRMEKEPESLEEVEAAADALRDAWRLGLDPIENVTEVLEDNGVRVSTVEASEKFSALAMSAEGGGPVIAVNSIFPGDRQRFSLAHELGHILLQPAGTASQDFRALEKAMDRFAAAFIVPKTAARSELGSKRQALNWKELLSLKHKYGLSMQGWVCRARDLGIIRESTARATFRTFGAQGWRRREPGNQLPPEEPQRMKRLVLKLLAEGVVSESRAAELLRESVRQFRQETVREPDAQPAASGH